MLCGVSTFHHGTPLSWLDEDFIEGSDLFHEKHCCDGSVVLLKQRAATDQVISPSTRIYSYVYVCVRGLLLQHRLPLPQSLSDGEAGDHAMDLGSPLAHVILNVEDKRLLAKVGVYDFTWSLKTHSGVQIWLENTR